MKTNLVFVGGFLICLSIGLAMRLAGHDPERNILGTWTEVSWSYEKMDHTSETDHSWLEEISDLVKTEISSALVIHEAEEWHFQPNQKLSLTGQQKGKVSLTWKLKGRGNILEIYRDGMAAEQYSIQELTEDQMILHFNTDLQTRGIVKMVFERNITGYAAK